MSSGVRSDDPTFNSKFRILLVEDDPFNREVITEIIEGECYDVLAAKDGLDALSILTEPLPDLIISDLHMPRMSGFEFLAVVRQKFPHIPVIAMSGEFEDHAVPAGVYAHAFLPKANYTPNQLRAKIRELLPAPARRPPPRPLDTTGSESLSE